jgi:prepilin-type N-terminal cleavage/methylation domain-containing protein
MKKGFTLVELLATILILAVISTIALVGFQSISKKIKKVQYENKVSLVETKAASYASENGYLTTNVQELIDLGYLEADNNKGELINPVDNSSMNCHIVTIKEDEDIFYGSYTDTEECDADNLDATNINLDIIATTESGKTLDSGNWTNENVYLSAKFLKNVDVSTITKITWYSSSTTNEIEVNGNFNEVNKYLVSAEQILNTTYKVEVELNDGTKYEAKRRIKIDKQNPVVYKDDIIIDKENVYTINSKTVTIRSSDYNGSGIKGYYVGKDSTSYSNNTFYESSEEEYKLQLENGNYYVWVVDNVGNISDVVDFLVTKVDNTAPTCEIVAEGTKGANDWYISNVTFSLVTSDNEDGSGVKKENISATELKENTAAFTVKGNVTDKAGNKGNCELTVKRDVSSPTITSNANPTYIYYGTSGSPISYFTTTKGVSDATTSCTTSNLSNLSLGVNNVTCTITGGNGKTASASITFRHQYSATPACSGGRTLSGTDCTYYYSNNQSQCGCATWNTCANSACGIASYNSCATAACGVASYNSCANAVCGTQDCNCTTTCSCTLYKSCTKTYCVANSSSYCSGSYDKYSSSSPSGLSCSTLSGSCSGTRCYSKLSCTGRQSGCGSETVYGCSTCANASSLKKSTSCDTCNKTCTNAVCGVASYNSCANSACGVASYNSCATSGCGCKTGASCTKTENNYRYYYCASTGNNGTNGTLSGTTCTF